MSKPIVRAKGKSKRKQKQDPETLRDLLISKLQALYDAEIQLVKALPKVAKKTTDADLREAIQDHLQETEGHVERLERVFELMEIPAKKIAGAAIRGLISDMDGMMKVVKDKAALDACIAAAAQYVEYYEIAGYESAIEWAERLECDEVAELLQQTLDEEEGASDTLADVSGAKLDEGATGEGNDREGDNRGEKSRQGQSNAQKGNSFIAIAITKTLEPGVLNDRRAEKKEESEEELEDAKEASEESGADDVTRP